MSSNKLDKPKSRLRSMAGMIKMPSSTSNSGSTTDGSKKIDDVPLNEKVSKKTPPISTSTSNTAAKSKTKSQVAPVKTQTTTVTGNKDLKLKVSHNDAGRVTISLSNTERVLVHLQVDESVLKKGALKKNKKTVEKERPKKKPTITKTSRSTAAKVHHHALPNPKKQSSATPAESSLSLYSSSKQPTTEQPRDLPDERSSRGKRIKDKMSCKSGPTFAQVPSSADSLGSHSMACSDDDSTRSPKDLFRAVPATPNAAPSSDAWDRRKQKLMHFRRQGSGLPSMSGHSMRGPREDSAQLHDFMVSNTSTEAKLEETASHDGSGIFASPFQQRRLQQRRKRLDRQRADNETAFRSTRSIRSTASGEDSRRPREVNKPQSKNNDGSTSQDSGNKAKHTRTLLPPDDEDDSEMATSNRIRSNLATLAQVRKVELANKGRSSSKDIREGTDEELLLVGDHQQEQKNGKAGNWVTKLCDKVCHKRSRKDHNKL